MLKHSLWVEYDKLLLLLDWREAGGYKRYVLGMAQGVDKVLQSVFKEMQLIVQLTQLE